MVPLRSGSAVIGTLEVAGRLGDLTQFGEADVRLLETLAAHAAVAVENSRLVDRLRFDAYHDALTGLPNRRRRARRCSTRRSRSGRPARWSRSCCSTSTGCATSTTRSGTPPATSWWRGRRPGCARLAPAAALVGRVGGDEFVVTLRLPDADAAVALADELRDALQEPMAGRLAHPRRRRRGRHRGAPRPRRPRPRRCSSGPTWPRTRPSSSPRRCSSSTRPGVAIGPPARPRRRPAPRAGERRARGLLPAQGRAARPAAWSASSAWPAGSTRRTARSSPEDFVAVAEHTGQLGRLTDVVLREGLRRARRWLDAGRPLPVAVNLSAAHAASTRPSRPTSPSCCAEYGVPARPAHPGDHRGRHGRRARPADGRPCGGSTSWAYGWPWTTSAPATRRCPTCAGCRCTRSRSTGRSCRAWRPTPATWRSCGRWSTWPGTSAWPWSPRAWRAS